ncbi:hypothetical protein T07_823 [Trichinella nelsoni]|uniref:Uncharacterized protein n=1 Tax=Trichinella nelsoni TaxID=6336 RepID=A0A0V0RT49_9BILA|nr:hypothetical protein T07_823 [Trichinella nelsoni]
MHSQQYSITVLICSWANRNRIPHSGWLAEYRRRNGYSTTNALGKALQISYAKVVYNLKQSAAKGGDDYSTLANAKWDNPLSSISDVELFLAISNVTVLSVTVGLEGRIVFVY